MRTSEHGEIKKERDWNKCRLLLEYMKRLTTEINCNKAVYFLAEHKPEREIRRSLAAYFGFAYFARRQHRKLCNFDGSSAVDYIKS